MNILIPFVLVFVIGYLLFHIFHRRNMSMLSSVEYVVVFWLGISSCVAVTFYSFIFFNQYSLNGIKFLTSLLLVLLLLFYCLRSNRFYKPKEECKRSKIEWLVFLLLALMAYGLMQGVSSYQPYGGWDAWSFWNYRARYFFNAESHWKDVCVFGTLQGQHGWFLPMWTVFGWTWTGIESDLFPRISAQVFGLILLVTVFFGILELTSQIFLAVIGSLWLISIPFFITHTVSQYADVVLAGFITMNLLFLIRLDQKLIKTEVIIYGFMLGLMTFVKDEGLVAAFIIIFMLGLIKNFYKKFFLIFSISLGISLIPTLLVKSWFKSTVVSRNSLDISQIIDVLQWNKVCNFFIGTLVSDVFGGIVIVPIVVLLFMAASFRDRTAFLIGLFLVAFIAFFFGCYLMLSDNLSWRLLATGSRLVYVVMPISILLLFYVVSLMKGKNG